MPLRIPSNIPRSTGKPRPFAAPKPQQNARTGRAFMHSTSLSRQSVVLLCQPPLSDDTENEKFPTEHKRNSQVSRHTFGSSVTPKVKRSDISAAKVKNPRRQSSHPMSLTTFSGRRTQLHGLLPSIRSLLSLTAPKRTVITGRNNRLRKKCSLPAGAGLVWHSRAPLDCDLTRTCGMPFAASIWATATGTIGCNGCARLKAYSGSIFPTVEFVPNRPDLEGV